MPTSLAFPKVIHMETLENKAKRGSRGISIASQIIPEREIYMSVW